MAWQILTPKSLLTRLSGAEHAALDRAATGWTQSDPLAEIAHEVAEDWRGGLRRVTKIDSRADAIPSEILIHVLSDYRYRAFTRLPGMRSLLDELRVKEWERALETKDHLAKVSFAPPDDIEPSTDVPVPSITNAPRRTLD